VNQVNTNTGHKSTFAGLRAKLIDYGLLIKFKLSLLVVFSAVVSYLYASPSLDWVKFFWLIIGGMFVTGASNTLNQVLEKDFDVLMNRTLNRPLPAKRMEVSEAVLFAGLLSVVGVLIFLINFNPLASILSALSLISYAFMGWGYSGRFTCLNWLGLCYRRTCP
jgi:protoheme IX farnesyltransferase